VNKYRNEIQVELNGAKYLLRPTFTCLSEIEDFLSMSIFQFMAVVMAGQMKMKQAFFIFDCGIKAAGGTVTKDELQQNMSEGGLNQVIQAINDFLVAATKSGDLAKKN